MIRLNALQTFWREHPPLYIMVAAYLGIGVESGGGSSGKKESFGDLIAKATQVGGKVKV